MKRTVVLLTILLQVLALPRIGVAQTSCTYNLREVAIELAGQRVTLSVGPSGEIFVDQSPCVYEGDELQIVATVDNTFAIRIRATGGGHSVVIDQAGAGGPFPSSLDIYIYLLEGTGDELVIIGTDDADRITASGSFIDIDRDPLDGSVFPESVEAIEIDAGAGNDVVDAGMVDADLGSMTMPLVIHGGPADDVLTGGASNDRVYGDDGNDFLDGGNGTDLLNGGEGIDACRYLEDVLSCDPGVQVQPAEGTLGTSVVVSGTGWYPENGDIGVYFGGADADAPIRTEPPDPVGSFNTTFDVPFGGRAGDTARVETCQLCRTADEMSETTTFAFAPEGPDKTLAMTPRRAAVGNVVSVSGAGWTPGELVSLFVDPPDVGLAEPIQTAEVDADGLFETTFHLPNLEIGRHRLAACQRCDGEDSEEIGFRIQPVAGEATLRLEPPIAGAGDEIDVVGTGWRPDLGDVLIYVDAEGLDDASEVTATPRPDGTFRVPFTLPGLPEGGHTMRACQRCSDPQQVEASQVFTIEPASSVLPRVVGGVVLLLLAVAAFGLTRRMLKRRQPPPRKRVRARGPLGVPEVTVSVEPDGSTHHSVRLVPHRDAGTQRVEEMSRR